MFETKNDVLSGARYPTPNVLFKTAADVLREVEVGQLIRGKGVYLGEWAVGKKSYIVYIASEDLKDRSNNKDFTFDQAAKEVAGLENLNCQKGSIFPYHTLGWTVVETIALGQFDKPGWLIPPLELVNGMDMNGQKVRDENMYDYRNTRDLKGTFTMTGGKYDSSLYMSSTDNPKWICSEDMCPCARYDFPGDYAPDIHAVDFSDETIRSVFPSNPNILMKCRPCRFEELIP